MINLNGSAYQKASEKLAATVMSGDATQEQLAEGMNALAEAIAQEVGEQYRSADGDRAVLAQRGFHPLTSAEDAYFRKFIDAAKNARTKQDFLTSMTGANMPETVIDEVMSQVKRQHPLLDAINSRAVARITKMYFNAGTAQCAVWGDLDATITAEIAGAFKEVDASQSKLSAFAQIARDELELGPVYIEQLIVATLGEAIANGLEQAVVTGSGLHGPIGLDRDIHNGVSVSTTTGYPKKSATAVTSFTPKAYGALVAQLMTDEGGNLKSISVPTNAQGVTTPPIAIACNVVDYLTKIMPATTVLNTAGNYVNGLFPIPTAVYTSAYVATGEAILFIPSEYYLLVAGDRGVEPSDEFKFLEDKRVYKQVMYGAGRAKDNTSAIRLNIAGLDEAYVTVKTKADAASE